MFWLELQLTTLTRLLTGTARRIRDEEDGLTTTEVAVITFLLVGAAIVVMGIIYVAATNSAENIPVPSAPG
jgi:hypothetical protein